MTTIGVVAHNRKTLGGGLEELRSVLADAGFGDPPWIEVDKSKRVPKAVRKLVGDGVDLLLVWGGDGTVQRTIDTLMSDGTASDVTVGILPAGTANLLANGLGVPIDLRKAVEAALHGARRVIDVGRVNGEHFAVMAGTGFDALMIREADRGLKDRWGRAAYLWTGARNLSNASAEVTVDVDGERWFRGRAGCVLVGNFGTLIGGVRAFPNARPDDGRLEVGVVQADNRREWARVLARTAVGKGDSSPLVHTTHGAKIKIGLDRVMPYELDGGDRPRTAELKVRIRPAAITVCVPTEGT
jgi:YegS/Rv2252/BmrU family lipid kinase